MCFNMEIIVKILQGQELKIQVSDDATIADVKFQVSEKSGIHPDHQRVVSKGKALQDHSTLRDCGIVSGSKLFLTVKKAGTTTAVSSVETKVLKKQSPLWDEMLKFLQRHFTDTDAKKVLEKMRESHDARIKSLSLDDIERLAHMNLAARKQKTS